MADRKRLTAQDWTTAALEALAAGGIAAVAVEPLASRLGTTKGSFYWHFSSRDALLRAALAEWERSHTEDVIARIDAASGTDVRDRLRILLTIALGHDRAVVGGRVELALQPNARHPLVAPVLDRVTQRRLEYLDAMFAELGAGPNEARRRSTLAYTAYLGHAQLAHATPHLAPTGDALASYIDAVITTLTSR